METNNLICFNCLYWDDIDGCGAFPNGIPDEILEENKHDKPLPEQTNSLIFTPKPKEDDAQQTI
jgi:hypothetical protein